MEIEDKLLEEIIDYTWTLEEQLRTELLENFNKLADHKSEIDKIRDKLIDIKIKLIANASVSNKENHSPEKSDGECLNKVVDVSQSPSPSGDDLVSGGEE